MYQNLTLNDVVAHAVSRFEEQMRAEGVATFEELYALHEWNAGDLRDEIEYSVNELDGWTVTGHHIKNLDTDDLYMYQELKNRVLDEMTRRCIYGERDDDEEV